MTKTRDDMAEKYELSTNFDASPCDVQFIYAEGWEAALKHAPEVLALLTALETYAMTNETFPEYGDVARQTLTNWKKNQDTSEGE